MDFTTDDWEFRLDDTPADVSISTNEELLPFISTTKAWEQYSDPVIYETDKLIRDWISIMRKNSRWCSNVYRRKYTMSMIFEQIYGRPYDQKIDAKKTNKMQKVLAYYSTRVQTGGSIDRKKYTKTIYTISPKRVDKPPYSLRLRVEWLAEQGKIPTYQNMRMPKDDLEPGHARNPRTDKNMQRRREQARKIYVERYKGR